jgi:NAD(P)-dependent dehydrogenase (short-subunit alcohol dehydrogenase family)
MKPLTGKVIVVTGASRGIGRGIACVLGAAGATVYVTGRSVAGAPTTENLPGTVDETAAEITARGGVGLAVRCDHTNETDVAALFDRVQREQGRLDLLVNNAWGGYAEHDIKKFVLPFWEQPLPWEQMFTAGLRAQMLTARRAIPLMLPHRSGLIISTVAWDHNKYLGALAYDVVKHATVRFCSGLARELKPHGVAALALAPGFTRTERVLAAHAAQPFDLSRTESPEYSGRAVVALATDANVLEKSGQAFRTGELAREYGFTDVDGQQVPPFDLPK